MTELFPCPPFPAVPAVHRGVPREHPPAPVPGHVPAHRGRRGDLHGGHQERVQPQADRAQEVRPEGEALGEAGSSSGTVGVGSGNPSLVGFAQGIEVLGGCGWSSNVGPFLSSQEITKRGLSAHFKNAFLVFLHGEI